MTCFLYCGNIKWMNRPFDGHTTSKYFYDPPLKVLENMLTRVNNCFDKSSFFASSAFSCSKRSCEENENLVYLNLEYSHGKYIGNKFSEKVVVV